MKFLKKIFSLFGIEISRKNNFNKRWGDYIIDCSEEDNNNINLALKYSLTSKANLWSLIQSLKHISEKGVIGDIVECGVFKGGSLGLMTLYAKKYQINCKIFGYDTFEDGFLKSTFDKKDVSIKNEKININSNKDIIFPSKNQVEQNLKNFSSEEQYFPNLIKGNILKTLLEEKNIPEKISLLRLDTDLYSTTKLQLETLYPKLEIGGVLHIDDYGMCPGVKTAVDEYFINQSIWLHRVDLSCRLMIKS